MQSHDFLVAWKAIVDDLPFVPRIGIIEAFLLILFPPLALLNLVLK
jgi:hypothetical protein